MDSKQAYKLGFILKMAEEGQAPSSLYNEKLAFKGLATLPLGLASGLGMTALVGIPALTAVAGGGIGGAGGSSAAKMLDLDIDDIPTERKKALLKKYQQLIKRRRAELSNRLLTQVKKQPDEEEPDLGPNKVAI